MCLSARYISKVICKYLRQLMQRAFSACFGCETSFRIGRRGCKKPGRRQFATAKPLNRTASRKHVSRSACRSQGHDRHENRHAMNAPSISLTSPSRNADYLLRRCWRIQDCHSCLHTSDPCSWCTVSSTCIPNEVPIAIFAPIWKAAVCPLKEERWELRAKGTGCKVSTITLLSFIVAVAGTIIVAFSIWALFVLWAWSRRRWKEDRWGLRSLEMARKRGWSRPRSKGGMHNAEMETEHTRLLA